MRKSSPRTSTFKILLLSLQVRHKTRVINIHLDPILCWKGTNSHAVEIEAERAKRERQLQEAKELERTEMQASLQARETHRVQHLPIHGAGALGTEICDLEAGIQIRDYKRI